MKSLIIISFVFLGIGYVNSQSSSELDNKYGFKKFKLNTPVSQLQGQIIKKREKSNIAVYNYVKGDIKEVFQEEISSITLYYFKDRLMTITIDFEWFDQIKFEHIKYNLNQLYGEGFPSKPFSSPDIQDGGGFVWSGKKVNLELVRFKFLDEQFWRGYISVTENTLRKKSIEGDF